MMLDVSSLPIKAFYGPEGGKVDLAPIVLAFRSTIKLWARSSLVITNASFGFAMANPFLDLRLWDDPYQFTWFTAGWGPKRDIYVANAVRKLRPALRHGLDTLDMCITCPEAFINTVDEQEADGSFEWGDFPHGGATFVRVGDLILPSSVSCLKAVEDDPAAKTIGGHIGAAMLKLRDPDMFA